MSIFLMSINLLYRDFKDSYTMIREFEGKDLLSLNREEGASA